MAYIRKQEELLTGYQESGDWSPEIDLQVDFVMVYGIDSGMPERIRAYREKGYVVHVMAGSAWGPYQDFLNGEWDGRTHWDESQTDRYGNPILHGVNTPYLVPSVAFSDYLADRLKTAVDAGAEAIHLEEPEFWDDGGYSEGFKREYRLFYGEDWTAPHTSSEARYRASRLKVYLYKRLLSRVSESVKEYAMTKYAKRIAFYVPTHSLVNYTQWKILSPEATLLDIPTVDGCIAQVWTGTSRVGNVYAGKYDERTFETAFLEYGVMQELVRGTGRKMWFLHDPVEDFPEYTWEDFRRNYLKTVTASLLHPDIHTYEVCPWPTRVFRGVYPKKLQIKSGIAPGEEMEGAKPIPESYAALLCAVTQLLGDMDQKEAFFDNDFLEVGLFMSDSGLYQRTFSDDVSSGEGGVNVLNDRLFALLKQQKDGKNTTCESHSLMEQLSVNEPLFHDYVASGAFPHFFGLAMPLVKCGLPIRPVQFENITRAAEYLARYRLLILSYEWMKPASPACHLALAQWVKNGGTLLYVGDGSDPYHTVSSWWNTGTLHDPSPASHLFRLLDLSEAPENGVYSCGKGRVSIYSVSPARITLSKKAAEEYRSLVHRLALLDGHPFLDQNYFLMHRGPYRIANVMTESVSDQPLVMNGLYADLLTSDFDILTQKTLYPGENALLFDFSEIESESVRIIGASARVFDLSCKENGFILSVKAAGTITARLRLRLPRPIFTLNASDEAGERVDVSFSWDNMSRTALLSYKSKNRKVYIDGSFTRIFD